MTTMHSENGTFSYIPSHSSAQPLKDYYTILYRTAMQISSSLELDEVLQSIVKSVTEAMSAKASVLRLLDSETGQLYLSAEHGLGDFYPDRGPIDPNTNPIDSETLRSASVYVPDVRVDPKCSYHEAARCSGLVSALSVPLELRGEAIGLLRVYTAEAAVFSEEDVQFLSVLASLAAQAIENARLFRNLKNTYSGVIDAFWGMPLSLGTDPA
jgi:GAF domain-containing protein